MATDDKEYYRLDTDCVFRPPVQISWHGLSVTAKTKTGYRELLQNVTGGVKPGEFLAIMGPTGAGKTTFLNTICKRGLGENASVSGGRVNYNANDINEIDVNDLSGFVPQEDVLMDVFSVREVLMFSANLRLPHLNTAQKWEKVEKMIEIFGLTAWADTRIGNEFVRGLSGGEKKRTSIAFELISDPQVLFLDEPTTGLDSYTANHVIGLLNQEAERTNKTIVATIHQPSSQIFASFDRLLLLSNGNVVFQGRASEAVPYFSSKGLHCPDQYNPADFFMTILSGLTPIKDDTLKVSHINRSEISNSLYSMSESLESQGLDLGFKNSFLIDSQSILCEGQEDLTKLGNKKTNVFE